MIFENIQFIKVHWTNTGEASLMFYDKCNGKYMIINLNNYVDIVFSDKRHCVGGYNLELMEMFPCNDLAILGKGPIGRCIECDTITGFTWCLKCEGDRCFSKNIKALKYCTLDHIVYLAYFPDKVIKVGTALMSRTNERLLEQGALYSLVIAKADGLIVRKIEKAISVLNVRTKVSNKYKIENLYVDKNLEKIESILHDNHKRILSLISNDIKSYFIKPDLKFFIEQVRNLQKYIISNSSQLSLFGEVSTGEVNYKILSDKRLKGNLLFAIGQIIVLEDKDILYAVDMNKYIGYLVNIIM